MRRIKISTELDRILEKIRNKENFAISRFGDGEMTIINNKPINLGKTKGEFDFDPNNQNHQQFRLLLTQSLQDNMPGYIKGVPCFCCANEHLVRNTLGMISDKSEITLANLFVNNNITRFKEFLETVEGRNIIVVCDWRAAAVQNPNVPLNIRYAFRTKGNCVENLHLLHEISGFINKNDIKDYIFLFFSGPLSNVMSHQLYKMNPNNTYIDMGSVFDPIFYGKKTRLYHDPKHYNANKICVMEIIEDDNENI